MLLLVHNNKETSQILATKAALYAAWKLGYREPIALTSSRPKIQSIDREPTPVESYV